VAATPLCAGSERAAGGYQRLAAVPIENGGFTEPLAVIYRERKKLSPAMKDFMQALKPPALQRLKAEG